MRTFFSRGRRVSRPISVQAFGLLISKQLCSLYRENTQPTELPGKPTSTADDEELKPSRLLRFCFRAGETRHNRSRLEA
jgi:hypothetical protein